MPERTDAATEAAVVQAYQAGEGGNTISNRLGVGLTTVYHILERHGVGRRDGARPKMFSPSREAAIARRYAAGERPSDIAADVGCSSPLVRNIAARLGVTLRERGDHARRFNERQRAEMVRLYTDGVSQQAIADQFGTSQITVSRIVRDEGVDTGRGGERHHNWIGGRINTGQYVSVRVPPDDPYASMRTHSGYVLEHRLVMAQQLGRPLTNHETVHHINGDKHDNRPENLQLRQGRHGKGEVLVCADCGSRHIVHAALG